MLHSTVRGNLLCWPGSFKGKRKNAWRVAPCACFKPYECKEIGGCLMK